MKKIEIVGLAIVAFSASIKLFGIPGGAVLSILSIAILSMIYFVGGYFLFGETKETVTVGEIIFQKSNSFKVMLNVLLGACLSQLLIGILFKLMHWPGAAVILIVGLVSIAVIGMIALIKYLKTKEIYFKKMLIRISLFAIISLPLLLGWL